MKSLLVAGAVALSATSAFGQGIISYTVEEDIEDVLFYVENAIIDKGLVIDHRSHVGEMLFRTGIDLGASEPIYRKGEVISFCSATLSRKMMEIDPLNIAFCPYGIFVYATPDNPGVTIVGYREMPEGPMKEVEAFLGEIVEDAVGE